MGRIKEIERKASGRRKRKSVVYLICEGSETEIRYFKKFRSRECNIDIVPIPSQYKSADKLVQRARATIGYSPYYPDEGDMIWCVFDRDDNTNAMLSKAKQVAIKEVYELLKPLQEAAIDRAKKRVAVLQAEHTEILSRESNPVTTVAELVEYLNSKQ